MKVLGLLSMYLCAGLVFAASESASIKAIDPWIRDAPKTAMMRSAYVVLNNAGSADIEIVAAESKDFGLVEMHETRIVDDVARMFELPSVTIAAGKQFAFKPGAAHFMLMQPSRALAAGDVCVITLIQKSGARLDVEFKVGGPLSSP